MIFFLFQCYSNIIQGGPKKAPYFVFHPKVVFYNFFPHIFQVVLTAGLGDSFDTRRFTTQQPTKNHRSVLCDKISSFDTAAMQERLWQGQCTWQKDNSTFGGQILRDRKCSRCPTKSTVVNIVQIVQIQQVRLIFNPLTDIFTKWFLVLLYFVQFAYARSEFCKERAEGRHGRSSKMMFSKCQLFFERHFWGNPLGIPVNSEYS